ncbi:MULTISPECIES: hypothetical protein [Corallococcus]|uniref:hypothetical protein n=1 Tax=Corallococcus TaxID=83461 RepID=UPI0011813971|nr:MULTISPECIES: hypothetical protein [Corallococcus]NBD08516.1 hypothetical protein [Corallococcus silvisoli]TSC33119.1 hypothetical protein FOF48_05645 [Corallococcus sp. Z5C101001]
MTEVHAKPREYTLPEGCPVCESDLPVRVSASGPNAVCTHCGWRGRPFITVTHQGLRVSYDDGARA